MLRIQKNHPNSIKFQPRLWFRLLKIFYIWIRYGLDEIALSTPWLSPFKFIVWLNPLYWLSHRKLSQGERLKLALEKLGPLFIKFGQILSTRRDFLPEEISQELAKLQDHVRPFDSNLAIKIIEQSLRAPISSFFSDFDPKPLASASIAQVHSAKLKNNQEIVIKVLRPGIEKIIRQDIALMYFLARLSQKTMRLSRRLKAVDIVAEIERTILDELDLMREGANAVQLRRNNQDNPKKFKAGLDNKLKFSWLKIPEIYWEYSSAQILVMERIYGISISNLPELKKAEINCSLLAERMIQLFYQQAFNDCFFHADMHPGNIFVSRENPEDPVIQLVDFGIVGSLDETDQHYLAANFLAFFKQDFKQVAKLHIESGWVPQKTRVDEFESAMRAVCEPIFDKPLKDISLGQTLMRLIQIAQRFDMIIQPQLLLLQKTLWNIEGIGRNLYPDLDIWKISKPFLENWMKEQIGFKGVLKKIKQDWPSISQSLPQIPGILLSILKNERQRLVQLRDQKEKISEQDLNLTESNFVLAQSYSKTKTRFLSGFLLGLGLGVVSLGFSLKMIAHLITIPPSCFIASANPSWVMGIGAVGIILGILKI